MSGVDRINGEIDSRRTEIIDFAVRLVRQLSETPPGDETKVASIIQEQAKRWGLPSAEVVEAKENRPNLPIFMNRRRRFSAWLKSRAPARPAARN